MYVTGTYIWYNCTLLVVDSKIKSSTWLKAKEKLSTLCTIQDFLTFITCEKFFLKSYLCIHSCFKGYHCRKWTW